VTYGDMMSLLLCFFILLAAFSELKKPDEYQKVIDAIQEAFGLEGGDSTVLDDLTLASSPDALTQGLMQKLAKERSRSDNNEVSTEGKDQQTATLFDGSKWTIGKPLPFSVAEHQLSDEHKQILRDLIAPRIHGSDRMFLVLGHAWGPDDRTGGMDFMELAYSRARSVYDYLVGECKVDPHSLSLWVAGASQPLKIDALAEQGATNRRVEVFMTDTPLSELHPDAAGTGRGG
jgi:chemotaxis protein MotB